MSELLSTRCTQGRLIITENLVKVRLSSFKEQSMSRSVITGVDSTMAVPSLFGLGGGVNLVFHGTGGERLHANFVRTKDANKIKEILGF